MLLLQESVFSECGISASFRWDEQGKCSPRPPDPAAEVLVDRIGWTMQIGVVVAAIDPIRFRLAVDGVAVVQAYQQIDQGFAGAGHLDGLGRPASSPRLSPDDTWADPLGLRFSHHHSEGQPPNQPAPGAVPLRHLASWLRSAGIRRVGPCRLGVDFEAEAVEDGSAVMAGAAVGDAGEQVEVERSVPYVPERCGQLQGGCSRGMMDFLNISAKFNPLPEPGAGERSLARLPG
jgi:hypothetical protein